MATWDGYYSIAWEESMVVEKKRRRLTLLIAGAGLLANELARRESRDLT